MFVGCSLFPFAHNGGLAHRKKARGLKNYTGGTSPGGGVANCGPNCGPTYEDGEEGKEGE